MPQNSSIIIKYNLPIHVPTGKKSPQKLTKCDEFVTFVSVKIRNRNEQRLDIIT